MSHRSGAVKAGAATRVGPGQARERVEVRPVVGRADRNRFIRLPWSIYAGDAAWVPPLLYDVRSVLSPRHPFYQHAEVQLFLAFRGGRTVGRIAAIANHAHNEFHGDKVGFFGLFEVEDDEAVARALLAEAEAWLATKGLDIARGPVNLSTNDELYSPGVVIDGFDRPPRIMMAHTPPYYAPLLEAAGYAKARDLFAFDIRSDVTHARLERAFDRVLDRTGARLRPVDMKRLDEEVDLIQSIYVSAWEKNWGFAPISENEIRHLAKQLKPVIAPSLCVIAEIDGEAIGFGLGLPDYNQVLKRMNGRLLPLGIFKLLYYRGRIDTARALTLGVTPKWRNHGLDAVLVHQLLKSGAQLGYFTGECSWILEDNTQMIRHLERLDARVYKAYRVFERPVSA